MKTQKSKKTVLPHWTDGKLVFIVHLFGRNSRWPFSHAFLSWLSWYWWQSFWWCCSAPLTGPTMVGFMGSFVKFSYVNFPAIRDNPVSQVYMKLKNAVNKINIWRRKLIRMNHINIFAFHKCFHQFCQHRASFFTKICQKMLCIYANFK